MKKTRTKKTTTSNHKEQQQGTIKTQIREKQPGKKRRKPTRTKKITT